MADAAQWRKRAEDGLSRSIRERQAQEWLRRNRAGLEAYNRQVEKHGVFSDALRAF